MSRSVLINKKIVRTCNVLILWVNAGILPRVIDEIISRISFKMIYLNPYIISLRSRLPKLRDAISVQFGRIEKCRL